MNWTAKLIAISGTKSSGKDTAAKMFQYCLSVSKIFRQYWIYKYFNKLFHKSWKIIAFADPMKEMLANLLNISKDQFDDRNFKENMLVNPKTLQITHVDNECVKQLSDSKFNKMVRNLDLELTNYFLTIRQLMQFYATNIIRKYFGEDIWINSTLKRANNKTIISDCRFINEANFIKNWNGILIYISRKEAPFGQHQSEKEMEQMLKEGVYDIIIDNNQDLKHLFNQIKEISKLI